MNAPKMPDAWAKASASMKAHATNELVGEGQKHLRAAADAGAKAKITARIDMSADVAGAGLCPECRQPMVTASANGHEVWSCHPCRIAIPTPDPVENVPLE